MFDVISRSIPMPVCHMYGRFPQPSTQAGSGVLVTTSEPKFAFAMAPHSPFAAVCVSTQSGRKLPRRGSPTGKKLSFQERVVLFTDARAGSKKFAIPVVAERM